MEQRQNRSLKINLRPTDTQGRAATWLPVFAWRAVAPLPGGALGELNTHDALRQVVLSYRLTRGHRRATMRVQGGARSQNNFETNPQDGIKIILRPMEGGDDSEGEHAQRPGGIRQT